MNANTRADEQHAQVNALATTPENPPEVPPTQLLDERLLAAPKDPSRTIELDRALRDTIASLSLGDTQVASLECAPSLCKLVFAAKTATASSGAVRSAMSQLPKVFASSVAYRVDDTHMAMYLGRSSPDIEVGAD